MAPVGQDTAAATLAAGRRQLASLLSQTDPVGRSRALVILVDGLGPADFAPMLADCREMHLNITGDVCSLLLSAWARIAPAAAADGVAGDSAALKIVITTWSGLDAGAAFDWVSRHATGRQADQLLPLVIPGISAGHPELATERLATLSPAIRVATLPGVAAQVMKGGDAAIQDWLDSFEPGVPRREALFALVQNISTDHPQQALSWMEKDPGTLASHYPSTGGTPLFLSWADRDPAAAREAFDALEPGTRLHQEALTGLIGGRGLRDDPAAIGALLHQFPDELDFFVLYRGMALTHEKDPSGALDLVSRMPPDTQELQDYYTAILGEWASRDPAAAAAWLDSHQVPAGVSKVLREK